MPNKRIDQLNQASNGEVNLARKTIVDIDGQMKSATLQQVADKVLGNTKTINGQAIQGTGNIVVAGTSLSDGGDTTTVVFSSSKYYGNVSNPASGNIAYNMVDAVPGMKAIIFHNDTAEPTYPANTYKLGTGIYVANELNIITITHVSATSFLVDVQRTTNTGLTAEVQAWLDKGGVATGFVLTALNQFMLDIASIRTKILRFNPIWGETFSSAFIPLIVNDDGSATPLGASIDSNNGFISTDYVLLGSAGGLSSQNSTSKFLDTGFIPNNVSQFGLNDASFGIYVTGNVDGSTIAEISTNAAGTNICSLKTYFKNIAINGAPINDSGTNQSNNPKIANRTTSSQHISYYGGSKSTVTSSSTSKDTSSFKVGRVSSSYACTIKGYFIGKGLTDADELTLRTAWITLNTKLAR